MPAVSGNVGAVFNGGTITLPLGIHVPAETTTNIALYNDTWDTDPNDPGLTAGVNNDGTSYLSAGGLDGEHATGIEMDFYSASYIRFKVAHMGFFNTGAVAKPAVTGAKLPSDTVMASLLTALAALGLVTDSTT